MSENLEDPIDTLRKRKKLSSSNIRIWTMNNQSKKDQSLTDVLGNLFGKDCVALNPNLSVSDETTQKPASVSSPSREAKTEVNSTALIQKSMVPDSTYPESTVHLSPIQQTEDVQDFTGPQSAHAESVARDTVVERLRMMVTTLITCRHHLQDFLLVEPRTSSPHSLDFGRQSLMEQSHQLPHI
ncbi:hypothetical protein EUTSA_v10003034mg [Eutrema salsugineum]|uniref:Uncharacterized protein n=1 Tax=Eutrema salsugineum TaxID=72664 RepID=V4LB85_EUTSA|nr:hypothetical protein EUTSA_v10003034mg [Eutrema salsugineum]